VVLNTVTAIGFKHQTYFCEIFNMTVSQQPTSTRVPYGPVLCMILCLPIAILAASNAPAEEPLFPVLSPIPIAAPNAPEAEAATFASHPAHPATIIQELPSEQLQLLSRKNGNALWGPEVDVTAGSSLLDTAEACMKLPKPWSSGTASPAHELNPKGSAKPSFCSGTDYIYTDTTANSTCRVYMYRNPEGTAYDMYTGYFVDSTHVITAGMALAPGGTGKYNVFAVNGRYGTVCCKPTLTGGPDTCPAAASYNITKGVTTTGWLSKGQISNAGAVLKVVGTTMWRTVKYTQADPFCSTVDSVWNVAYPAYPYPSANVAGCSNAGFADGSPTVYGCSYGAKTQIPGSFACTDAVDSPNWTFWGGACEGSLGAFYWWWDAPAIMGILTSISRSCNATTQSRVGFSAFTNGNTAWGIAVSKLVAAVP
jgi:hypothetical protein